MAPVAPTLHRLIDQGASTINARTERELPTTLPNHTGMLTGRRVNADRGGHGVTWNDDRLEPRTVQAAAGKRVRSVFSLVHDETRPTALFASKTKFTLFKRSWGSKIDRFTVRESNALLMRRVRGDLVNNDRAFRFVHFSKPDVVGHDRGFLSPAYLNAVTDVDRLGSLWLRPLPPWSAVTMRTSPLFRTGSFLMAATRRPSGAVA